MSTPKPATETEPFLNKWVTQPVQYTQRDLLLYAQGIGCTELPFTYEHCDDGFYAFPTFPIVLSFTGMDQDVVSFPSEAMRMGPSNPPLQGVRTVVDGERMIECIAPIPAEGAVLALKSALRGVPKGSGAPVETEQILFDEKTGVEYYRMTGGAFLVGAKNFEDSGKTFSEKITPPARDPDAVEEISTSRFQPSCTASRGLQPTAHFA